MLKQRYYTFSLLSLSFVLLFSSCTNTNLPWRSGHLVAQLYRQYKQEILLAYNDFQQPMIVDEQHGYARAYFDNYRKQMLFHKERTLDYLINGEKMTTATDEITGYVFEILINEQYQIGVEILDINIDDLGNDAFDGSSSRIIDLNTKESVTVDGLLFNRCLLVGDYFYGLSIDNMYNQFLDIIDVKTMEHRRIKKESDGDIINFLYPIGEHVYAQVESQKTAFLLDGLEMIEKREMYNPQLPFFEYGAQILKDIAPRDSEEHWYIEPSPINEFSELIEQVRFIQIGKDEIKTQWIKFNRDDIIQVMDVANYGTDHIALFLLAKTDDDALHAIISIFDLAGNEVASKEITEIRGEVGRFMYLDYVE